MRPVDIEFHGALDMFTRALKAAADEYVEHYAEDGAGDRFEIKLGAIQDAFLHVAEPLPHWSDLRYRLRAAVQSFHRVMSRRILIKGLAEIGARPAQQSASHV